MKTYAMIIATLFAFALPLAGTADTILNEIDATNRAFAKALLTSDIDYLVNDYTDNGCIIAPRTPKTCGKNAIKTFWEAVIASQPKNVEIVTKHAERESNMAYATGELIITDANTNVEKSRFVLVFKNIDGAWKLHVDSWTPQ